MFSVTGSLRLPPAGDTVPIKVTEPVAPFSRCTCLRAGVEVGNDGGRGPSGKRNGARQFFEAVRHLPQSLSPA